MGVGWGWVGFSLQNQGNFRVHGLEHFVQCHGVIPTEGGTCEGQKQVSNKVTDVTGYLDRVGQCKE